MLRRKRFWFDEPWQDADPALKMAALLGATQIIFADRSAVRHDEKGWRREERYELAPQGDAEADRFLNQVMPLP